MGKTKQKILTIISSFFLLFQSFGPYISFVPPAYAESTPEETQSKIEFNSDKNEFKVSINTKEEVEYILSYQTDKQTEAISGKTEKNDSNFERTFYAGTCSENGTCIKHNVLRGILKTKISLSNWLASKKFIFENGSLIASKDEVSTTLDLTDNETNWLNNGGDFVPEGDILDGIFTDEPSDASETPQTDEPIETEELQLDETLTINVIEDIDTSLLLFDEDTLVFNSSATLTTDKDDYAPTDIAIISGSGFNAGESYTLVITSEDEPAVRFEVQVRADLDGEFIYLYQLDGIYRPDYKVETYDKEGSLVATITFKDSSPTLNITRSGSGGGTVTSNDEFINCVASGGSTSGECSHTYGENNPGVILTAVADSESLFDGWTGGTCSGTGTCTPSGLTGNNDVTVEAIFNALPPPDTTPPTVTSSETIDEDGNGYLDGIQLTFSENINDAMLNEGDPDGWDVDGYDGESIGTGDTEDDSILILSFNEGSTYDTGNRPTVTYTPSGDPIPNSTHDSAGNELEAYEGSSDDKALPVLLSAVTKDWDADGENDTLELTFSEEIDDSLLTAGADGWDVDVDYNGESISSGGGTNDNVLFLTFFESGTQDTGTTPSVSYTQGGGDTSTHDLGGNELESNSWTTTDGAAPVSSFSAPDEGSFWNSPIDISGSSSDDDILGDGDTVDYVQLFYRESVSEGEENSWIEIDTDSENEGTQPRQNSEGSEPFPWSFTWTPDSDGTFDIKAEATDTAGNTESSPVVQNVVYDITDPTSNIDYPASEEDYAEDEWDGQIKGGTNDSLSGVTGVLVSIQRDSDNTYWDGTDDEDGTGWRTSEGELLNDISVSGDGSWTFDFIFITPSALDEGYTARSHAVDNAGNQENTTEVHFFFSRPPVISSEASSSVTSTSTTITWTTDDLSTSRVIYDTVSHPDPVVSSGESPDKYNYANTTDESDTGVDKTTTHSVDITGLTAGTTYYYRTISRGSPEAVSDQSSFTTTASTTTSTGTVAGASTGGVSTPTCSETKPGSAPSGLSAVGGLNSVTLRWNKASDPVSYYLVTYGLSSGSQAFGNPNVGDASTTSYTVSNLSGGITYYFKVRAGNGCAPGEFSNEAAVTPSGGFVEGPATGFAPGVLGVATKEANIKQEENGEQEILGANAQEQKTQNATKIWLSILFLLFILIYIKNNR